MTVPLFVLMPLTYSISMGLAFGLTQLLFVYIVWKTVRGGEKADDRVWEGAEGLEWTLPSPPPYHSFETAPEVK